jgi:hypothetical protein
MNLRRTICIFATTMLMAVQCLGQFVEEDIALLKEGRVFRGKADSVFTPGGVINVRQNNGHVVALYWSEITILAKLPVGIPDSLIVRYYLKHPGGKTPVIDVAGHQNKDDVLLMEDGSVMRGVQLNTAIEGRVGLWSGGVVMEIPESMIRKIVHVPTGIPDSTLLSTYVNFPEEWSIGEKRVLSIFGGFSFPATEMAKADDSGPGDMAGGTVFGLEAGFRITNGMRWLTSLGYASTERSMAPSILSIMDQMDDPHTEPYMFAVTGLEVRTFGPSEIKFRGSAQLGIVSMSGRGLDGEIPRTFYHWAAMTHLEEYSTTSFAACAGGGILYGRLGVNFRWLITKPNYALKFHIKYEYSTDAIVEIPQNDFIHIFFLTFDVSLF